ncbi:uncharacterized protein LOC115231505 [Octopus sinensis]|uniref:ATP-dependent DNA helicase n=1 Tax=Octopus sinensis TaxID=2607531 RepID=A0A6P7U1N4_9MOLL|nr:uncharacterized protein LOC115230066 [Octopus sinensis]XP_029657379.1 uncharacterized protein LOC115231505 [Octopus sinensis]
MAHKAAFKALDWSFRDIRDCQEPMGGVMFLLSGDFRQTLPVIPKGKRADKVAACLKASQLWHYIRKLTLSTNMKAQLQGDETSAGFIAANLLLGGGKVPLDGDGAVDLTGIYRCSKSIVELWTSVFPKLEKNCTNQEWLCVRAVLTSENYIVGSIMLCLTGNLDSIADSDEVVNYPTKFLNSLGLPDCLHTYCNLRKKSL